jgi:hypothetical protein
MVCPVSVQERLRGWRHRSLPFGRRPRVDSRAQLTRGRTERSNGRGDVLSPRASTMSRMALQCPGWRRGGGDGRTGLMVTEGTRPTSWHGPVRVQNRRPSPSRVPPSSFEGAARRPYKSGWHSVAELTLVKGSLWCLEGGGVNRITLKICKSLAADQGPDDPARLTGWPGGSGSPWHLCRINQCAGVKHNNLKRLWNCRIYMSQTWWNWCGNNLQQRILQTTTQIRRSIQR